MGYVHKLHENLGDLASFKNTQEAFLIPPPPINVLAEKYGAV